jgi:hypothetical protein
VPVLLIGSQPCTLSLTCSLTDSASQECSLRKLHHLTLGYSTHVARNIVESGHGTPNKEGPGVQKAGNPLR